MKDHILAYCYSWLQKTVSGSRLTWGLRLFCLRTNKLLIIDTCVKIEVRQMRTLEKKWSMWRHCIRRHFPKKVHFQKRLLVQVTICKRWIFCTQPPLPSLVTTRVLYHLIKLIAYERYQRDRVFKSPCKVGHFNRSLIQRDVSKISVHFSTPRRKTTCLWGDPLKWWFWRRPQKPRMLQQY